MSATRLFVLCVSVSSMSASIGAAPESGPTRSISVGPSTFPKYALSFSVYFLDCARLAIMFLCARVFGAGALLSASVCVLFGPDRLVERLELFGNLPELSGLFFLAGPLELSGNMPELSGLSFLAGLLELSVITLAVGP